jgi:Tfp pilus assembly protein PilN
MFNLLPEPEKKQILDEYKLRRLVVLLLFVFVVGLVAVVSIFPSYILASVKVSEVESNLLSAKNSPIFAEEATLTAAITGANQKLVTLLPPRGEAYVENILSTVISHKNDTIRLNGFSFTRGVSGSSDLLVNGVASNRDALSSFVDTLKKDSFFTTVDLPVSNFAKDANASFSIDIKGNF